MDDVKKEPRACTMVSDPNKKDEEESAAQGQPAAPTALGRDAILAAQDIVVMPVGVPEWGGTVYVRSLSGRERDAFEASLSGAGTAQNLQNFRARFAVLVLSDVDGNRLFADKDMSALSEKASKALEVIRQVGMNLNGMGEDVLEELAKNFASAQSDEPGSE